MSPSDLNMFELVLGTEDGQLYHTCLSYSPKFLEVVDPLVLLLDTQTYLPIHDIKLAKISNKQIVLAITDSSLHQFVQEKSIKKTFAEYFNNPQLFKDHTVRFDVGKGASFGSRGQSMGSRAGQDDGIEQNSN